MNIAIFGVPGAGKGTQCELLSKRLELAHISTGELIRNEIAEKSEIGIRAEQIIHSGKLLDDTTVFEMLLKKLETLRGSRGILFDGFPRTIRQAEMLDNLLADMRTGLHYFVNIVIPEEESVKRILKRAEIEGRKDDHPEAVTARFQEYNLKTAPISDHYKMQGISFTINGIGTIEEVYSRIVKIFQI